MKLNPLSNSVNDIDTNCDVPPHYYNLAACDQTYSIIHTFCQGKSEFVSRSISLFYHWDYLHEENTQKISNWRLYFLRCREDVCAFLLHARV